MRTAAGAFGLKQKELTQRLKQYPNDTSRSLVWPVGKSMTESRSGSRGSALDELKNRMVNVYRIAIDLVASVFRMKVNISTIRYK